MRRNNTERPVFDHDCTACVFLGRTARERSETFHRGIEALRWQLFDLYYCKQHGLPTVIARFGHGGDQYVSGLGLAALDPVLAEALNRADEKGLCTSYDEPRTS